MNEIESEPTTWEALAAEFRKDGYSLVVVVLAIVAYSFFVLRIRQWASWSSWEFWVVLLGGGWLFSEGVEFWYQAVRRRLGREID